MLLAVVVHLNGSRSSQEGHLSTFDWKKRIRAPHTSSQLVSLPLSLAQTGGGLYNKAYLWPHTTNRGPAPDTCRLSVSRNCIYLGNEGETFNFLKPISCQHRWLNISWARVLEWLGGAACKEVFTPLWLIRGYFPSCCPICCNPIIPSPLYSGAAVSGDCLTQAPPGEKKKKIQTNKHKKRTD